ncbi:MAG: DUF2231 domain-containing protein [Gallionella sp.]|nr:DUF2231 domain-containing protein [Gallionella sp.]
MTGRWMLWAAVIFACIAAVFGWLAYNSVEHDEAGHLAMTIHRNWALVALGALALLAAWDVWRGRSGTAPSPSFLVLLVAAWWLVVSAAWHGGEVVYRHGLGVMSLPAPVEHAHEHGEGHDHGDIPVQGEATLHEDGHAHSHDDTANGEHPHNAEPASKTPATDSVGTASRKAGHTHAPGTPPHKD